jgi:DNA gyrase subunit B
MEKQNATARQHFHDRSEKYNKSSSWVTDEKLLEAIFKMTKAGEDDVVLDIATGTGLVAKQFKGRVKEVIGLDISDDMAAQAKRHVDRLLISSVEKIPLADSSVDVCVCRQGLQFVNLNVAMEEIFRVLKPGGRVVFCHLNAYGLYDRTDAFEIQALRNPARVNFFIPGDLESVLEEYGMKVVEVGQYRSRESVNQWINHGASTEEERTEIKRIYRQASPEFKKVHELEFAGDDILDTMLFLTIGAEKIPETAKSAVDCGA